MCEMYKAHVMVSATLPTFPPDLWKFLLIVMLHFLGHVKDGVVKMGAGRSTHSMPTRWIQASVLESLFYIANHEMT